jgi:hypothetical protein
MTLASACLLVLGAVSAQANEQRPTVIELFTSQGCSSCPPADRLLNTLAERKDVIALTLAVSYWDYLGWKDTLASPEHNERQRRYAKKAGRPGVYTPQVIVNGLEHCVGSDPKAIEEAIAKTAAAVASTRVDLSAERRGGRLAIVAGDAPEGSAIRGARVLVMAAEREVSVAIQRGENAGERVTYSNVVRKITDAGRWTGQAATFDLPLDKVRGDNTDLLVVLLQDDKTGAIIAATQIERATKAQL